jgi:hypothetical protein
MISTRNMKIWLTICSLMLVATNPAAADTHYVNPGDSIQYAINAAVSGDEIEVAPGTYYEAIDFNGKAIRLYSSGGPDVTIIDASGLNSSVVTCQNGEVATTIIEGFTFTGGEGTPDDGGTVTRGGGMYNIASSPTVTNCIFTSNRAWRGGGMLNDQGSSPTVTNCTFTSNEGDYGGGMYNAYGSNSTVTNCTFENNRGNWFGGGMDNKASEPTVTNCTFSGNSAGYGGGMFNESSGDPIVTNCIFSVNSADYGGGMFSKVSSSPMVTNCTFVGNSATQGGGMWGDYIAIVTNCIFWNDTPDEIYDISSLAIFTYCDIQGGWPGTGNIDLDPLFEDPANGDYRLAGGSPCIDVGDNSAVPADITTDLDDNPRIVNDTVDMGAYEYQITLVQIDVKPGSYPNAININGNGIIPVAILGSADFDVTQVVIGSLSFAGLEVRVKPNGVSQCSISDVSGPEGVPDGYDDLVCQFVDDPLLWMPGDGIADLTGTFLLDGKVTLFKGSDEITIVP